MQQFFCSRFDFRIRHSSSSPIPTPHSELDIPHSNHSAIQIPKWKVCVYNGSREKERIYLKDWAVFEKEEDVVVIFEADYERSINLEE